MSTPAPSNAQEITLDTIRVVIQAPIATVFLHRPHRHNAWTGTMHADYLSAMRTLEDRDDIRAVIVTGTGTAFCVGGDSDALAKHATSGNYDTGLSADSTRPGTQMRPEYDSDLTWQYAYRYPIIAAIIGAAAALIIANWEPMAAAFSAAGGGIEGVGAALMTLGSIVYDWIANAVGPLIAALAVWATELWQWIAESWPKVVAQLGIWWGKFTTWLQSIPAKIPPLMVEWGKSMLSWISGLWDLAKPLFESWWGSIKTWFEGLPEIIKTTAGALGKAMIDGIGKGITDAAGALLDSLRGAVDGAMDGVKHFFGIRSPSKVFRDEIGLNLGDGIALGLVSSIGTIRAASIAAGQAAMMGAGRGSGAMMAQSSSVNYSYNYAPVYSATPSNPTADFQMMQSLARTI
jgi:hypothetical protein